MRGVGLAPATIVGVEGRGLEVVEHAGEATGASLVLLVRAEVDEALGLGQSRTATVHVAVPGGRFSVSLAVDGLPELRLPLPDAVVDPLPPRVSQLELGPGRTTLTATAPVHIEVVGSLLASGTLVLERGPGRQELGGCSPGAVGACERRSGRAGRGGSTAGGGGGGAGAYDGQPGVRASAPDGLGGDASADVSPFPLADHVGGAGGAGAGAPGPDGSGAGGAGAGVLVITALGRAELGATVVQLLAESGRPGASCDGSAGGGGGGGGVLGLRLLGPWRGELDLSARGGLGAGPASCRGGDGALGWLLVAPGAAQTRGEGRVYVQPTLASPSRLYGSVRDPIEILAPVGEAVGWLWRGRRVERGRVEPTGGTSFVPPPSEAGLYELCLGPTAPPASAAPDAWLCWPYAVTE